MLDIDKGIQGSFNDRLLSVSDWYDTLYPCILTMKNTLIFEIILKNYRFCYWLHEQPQHRTHQCPY
jgi:hypothetical protein